MKLDGILLMFHIYSTTNWND